MSIERNLIMAAAGNQVVKDSYFKQTTLLLHADGTNAAQNNTFLDSSTNNFTITRNGNTTQGTFTPFSQAAGYWSNYFDGDGDYLSVASNAAFGFGTGNFTIEFWTYVNSTANTPYWLDGRSTATANEAVPVLYIIGGNYEYYVNGTALISGGAVPLNQWVHVALVRNSGTTTLYSNGTSVGTASDSTTYATCPLIIGQRKNTASQSLNGYISNFRIVKGTAVYTSAFTPSTTPLTAITNTSLLTCQSNRFVDNSANNFTLTPSGTPSVQPFSPFAPTAAYSTSVNGGSGYFDGTGDSLVSASSANLTVGAGDFTLEFWAYITATSFAGGWGNTVSLGDGTWNGANRMTPLLANNFNYLRTSARDASGVGNIADFYFNNAPILPYQWNHIVLQRSGTTITAYCNGYQCTSGSIAGSVNIGSTTVTVGTGSEVAFPGYISSVRLLKGTALYSGATYTVPTAPLTAITNTQLLLSCTNAAIYDNAIKNDLETVGNAQISTSVKKYGTGSLAFDGTGDYLIAPHNPQQNLGSGDFTIEGWIYFIAGGNWNVVYKAGELQLGGDANRWAYSANPGVSNVFVISWTPTLNTWYHFACVRNGATTTMYINGSSIGSGSSANATANSTAFRVGDDGVGHALNGYLDDLRITKGVARYTANFTPPTSAFPNQ